MRGIASLVLVVSAAGAALIAQQPPAAAPVPKPGVTVGSTDELGYNPVEDAVDVQDLHATMLHLLGIDHTKLTYRFQGRDFRLTDVAGKVVTPVLV